MNLTLAKPTAYSRQKLSRRDLLPLHSSYLWQVKTGYVCAVTFDEEGTLAVLSSWRPGDAIGRFLSWLGPFQIECLTSVLLHELGIAGAGESW
jgi:hypothetical protein